MELYDNNKETDIFTDIAGGNNFLRRLILRIQRLWQVHANRRTAIIIFILLISGISSYLLVLRPPSDFPTNNLVTIEEGKSLVEISVSLKNQGVIRNTMFMNALAKLYNIDRNIHSGDYLFKEPVSMLEVIKRLGSGAFGLEPVTVRVREGSTVVKIADMLDAKMLKFDREKFIAVASKHEGYLFPDTYYFLPNISESKIVGAMTDNFHKQYAGIAQHAAQSAYSLHEIVTLASIVELEASKYEDRRKIAGVMYNRLAVNMPLQVDVSFVYIMNKGTFDITLEDLKHESPYNTYVHKGLPPGPIGSPSLASLTAVLDPIDNDWIFYLADSSGVTHYSVTYKEHLRKKRQYIDNR